MEKQKQKKEISIWQIFFFIILAGWIFTGFSLIITHGDIWNNIIFQNGNDRFADFLNHIAYVSNGKEKVYELNCNVCFPPLAYMFFHLLACILPENSIGIWEPLSANTYSILVYAGFALITVIMLFYAVIKVLGNVEKSLALIVSVCFSYTFISGVLERGSLAAVISFILILALYLKDSDNKIKKEIALILIAVAAGLKIYPAVFGLLYIKEKRWKETVRLLIYGILCFFVPFVFFDGIHGLVQMLQNQLMLHTISTLTDCISAAAAVSCITSQKAVMQIASCVVLVMLLAAFFIQKTPWKRYLILTTIMIVVPIGSGYYTVSYLVIPMVFFMKEKWDSTASQDAVYALLFSIAFSMFQLPTGIRWAHAICAMGVYLLVLYILVDTVLSVLKQDGRRRFRKQ